MLREVEDHKVPMVLGVLQELKEYRGRGDLKVQLPYQVREVPQEHKEVEVLKELKVLLVLSGLLVLKVLEVHRVITESTELRVLLVLKEVEDLRVNLD